LCDSQNYFQNIKAILPAVASWVRVAVAPASRATLLKFWDTIRRLTLLSSNFPSIPRASELPQKLASDLLRFGHQQSVSMPWTWLQPDGDRLGEFLSSLQLGRCLMILSLPSSNPPVSFDGSVLSEHAALPAGFINGTEQWYGTPYLATGISLEQLQSIDEAGAHMDNRWKLPGDNRFIPEDISLVTGNTDLKPHLVHSADTLGRNPSKLQVWHALENSFGSPKQVYFILPAHPKIASITQVSFFVLKSSLQYSHLETFCSSPPADSALTYVTAFAMSKLIANNLLPQVRF